MNLRTDRELPERVSGLREIGIDFAELRRERLVRIQRAMEHHSVSALLLTDPIHIRYATGLSVMPLWTAVNYARYAVIPSSGDLVIFEYPEALFWARKVWPEARPTRYWQHRFDNSADGSGASVWASEIRDVLRERDLFEGGLAVDDLDYKGYAALQETGVKLADADSILQDARRIKSRAEILLLQQAAAVTEVALYDFEKAIRPGISEHELLGVFWQKLLSLGGEWCYTRLVATGYRTNPWFHEASTKVVRPGDLVAIDTDVIGPHGYACDISRTFLCGDKATPAQKEAYRVAHDFVAAVMELCRPGVSYRELADSLPKVPQKYMAQRYPVFLHGLGTDDESPFLPFPDRPGAVIPEGELSEGMVACIEFYAGAVGGQDGVKLEDQVYITKEGPILMSHYPYEAKLLS